MGRLIIDGNSVFEIDEQCLKRRRVPKDCDVEKYTRTCSEKENQKKADRNIRYTKQ